MNKDLWLLNDNHEEGIIPVHHHSGDDNKDFLVDTANGEVVSEREANERAAKRLGVSRRAVVGTGLLAGAASFLAPSMEPRFVHAANGPDHTLVNVFLRGGVDGLNVLAPFQDAAYLAKRKTAIVDPAKGDTQLNGTFALNKAMAPLLPMWNNGHLSFAHAVGLKDQVRSHFEDQARLERCAPVTARTGWLGRYIIALDPTMSDYLAALGIASGSIASEITGVNPVLTASDLRNFTISAGAGGLLADSVLANGKNAGGLLGSIGTKTIESMRSIQQYTTITPANGASYSNTQFGNGLAQIANIIKKGGSLKVAAIDLGNWDTHTNEVNIMNGLMNNLSKDLAAFYTDLGSLMSKVTVLTHSEFGRTTLENGSAGCDHGYANYVMCMSGLAKPKTIAGSWAGLSQSVTDAQGDLMVTTDHRDIMGEILMKSMGASPDIMKKVFPDYTPVQKGILR